MANDNKPFFNINAEKILATLHLAGQQQVTEGRKFLINTAIVNPVNNPDPAKTGETKFDFSNKTGEYQAAAGNITSWRLPINLKLLKEYNNLIQEYNKLNPKQKDDKESENEDISLLSKKINNENDKKKLEDLQKKFLDFFKTFKLKDYKEDKNNFISSYKSFKAAIKLENENRNNEKTKNFEDTIKKCVKYLKEYFSTFSGKESANKINDSVVVLKAGDIDGKLKGPADFEYIKDFKIDITDLEKEIKENDIKQQTNKPNDYISRTLLCIVGFEVNQDTM